MQVGASCLQKAEGGFGVLLGGVPGVPPANVVILGGGVAGTHAVEMAVGLRADVTVVDRSVDRLRELSSIFGGALRTAYSTAETIERLMLDADLVIGAVLVVGAAAPKLVTRAMVKRMKTGAVLVDIAIDQGGCFETSHPTTHADPTFVVDGVIHYCVANMPGAVPRTSTFALTNATLPYVRALADHGWKKALRSGPGTEGRAERARGASYSPGSCRGARACLALDTAAWLPLGYASRALTGARSPIRLGIPRKETTMKVILFAGALCSCRGDGIRSARHVQRRPGPHLSELRSRPHGRTLHVARQVQHQQRHDRVDKDAKAGTVDITIDATSLDFGNDKLNEHAKGDADDVRRGEVPHGDLQGQAREVRERRAHGSAWRAHAARRDEAASR